MAGSIATAAEQRRAFYNWHQVSHPIGQVYSRPGSTVEINTVEAFQPLAAQTAARPLMTVFGKGLSDAMILAHGVDANGVGIRMPPSGPGVDVLIASTGSGGNRYQVGALLKGSAERLKTSIDFIDGKGNYTFSLPPIPFQINADNYGFSIVQPLLRPNLRGPSASPLYAVIPGSTEFNSWKGIPYKFKLNVGLAAENQTSAVQLQVSPAGNGSNALEAQANQAVVQSEKTQWLQGNSPQGVNRVDMTQKVPVAYFSQQLTNNVRENIQRSLEAQREAELYNLRRLQEFLELPYLQDAYRTELFCFLTELLQSLWTGSDESNPVNAFLKTFLGSETVATIQRTLTEVNKFLPLALKVYDLFFDSDGGGSGNPQPQRTAIGTIIFNVETLEIEPNNQAYLDQLNQYLDPEDRFTYANGELRFRDRVFNEQGGQGIDPGFLEDVQQINAKLPDPLKLQVNQNDGVTNAVQIGPTLTLLSSGLSRPPALSANDVLLNELSCRLPQDLNNALQLRVDRLPNTVIRGITTDGEFVEVGSGGGGGFRLPQEALNLLGELGEDFSIDTAVEQLRGFLPPALQPLFQRDENGIYFDSSAAIGIGLDQLNNFLPPALQLGGGVNLENGTGNISIGPLSFSWNGEGLNLDLSGVLDFLGGLIPLEILDFLPLVADVIKGTIFEATLPYDKLFGDSRSANRSFGLGSLQAGLNLASPADAAAANAPVNANPNASLVTLGPSANSGVIPRVFTEAQPAAVPSGFITVLPDPGRPVDVIDFAPPTNNGPAILPGQVTFDSFKPGQLYTLDNPLFNRAQAAKANDPSAYIPTGAVPAAAPPNPSAVDPLPSDALPEGFQFSLADKDAKDLQLEMTAPPQTGGSDTTIVSGGNIRPNARLYISQGGRGAPFPLLKLLDGCLQPLSQRSPTPGGAPGLVQTGVSPVTGQPSAPTVTLPAPICEFEQLPVTPDTLNNSNSDNGGSNSGGGGGSSGGNSGGNGGDNNSGGNGNNGGSTGGNDGQTPGTGQGTNDNSGNPRFPFIPVLNLDSENNPPTAPTTPNRVVPVECSSLLSDLVSARLTGDLSALVTGSPSLSNQTPATNRQLFGNFVDPDLVATSTSLGSRSSACTTSRPTEPVTVGNQNFEIPVQPLPPIFGGNTGNLPVSSVPVPVFDPDRLTPPRTPIVLTPEDSTTSNQPGTVLRDLLNQGGLENADSLIRSVSNLVTGSPDFSNSALDNELRSPTLSDFLGPIRDIAPLPVQQVITIVRVALGENPNEEINFFRPIFTERYFECESFEQFKEFVRLLNSPSQINRWVKDILDLPEVDLVAWLDNPLNIRNWLQTVSPRLVPAFEYLLLGDIYNFLVEALALRQGYAIKTVPEQALALRFSVASALGLAVPGPDIVEAFTNEL